MPVVVVAFCWLSFSSSETSVLLTMEKFNMESSLLSFDAFVDLLSCNEDVSACVGWRVLTQLPMLLD